MSDTTIHQFEGVTLESTDLVATITIDSPETNNACTPAMADGLVHAFEQADTDETVRVVILTGRGRFFCPGAHLSDGTLSGDRNATEVRDTIDGVERDLGGRVTLAIAAMRKPVISAINGAAAGFGTSLVLPTDIRIASERAKLGFVFNRRGLVPEGTSNWFLPRIVGITTALEWVLTGATVSAQEAWDAGLLTRVVAHDDVLAEAQRVARLIATECSPAASGASRQLMWSMLAVSSPWESHRLESAFVASARLGTDVREGVSAFLQKRDPSFRTALPRDFPPGFPRLGAGPDDR